jgi:hypothetical protein
MTGERDLNVGQGFRLVLAGHMADEEVLGLCE